MLRQVQVNRIWFFDSVFPKDTQVLADKMLLEQKDTEVVYYLDDPKSTDS